MTDWIARLEQEVFGQPWGAAAPQERVWTLEDAAFARWSVVEAAGEAELLRIAVAPHARRRGLGHRLLEACEADLASCGIHELFLEVRASNTAARRLYAAHGWTSFAERPGYYADGETAVLFRKAL